MVLIHGLGADHSMWDCRIRKYPEMVKKLVIVDSFSSIGGYAMRFNSKLALILTKLFSKAALIKLINSAYRGRGEEMQKIREYFR